MAWMCSATSKPFLVNCKIFSLPSFLKVIRPFFSIVFNVFMTCEYVQSIVFANVDAYIAPLTSFFRFSSMSAGFSRKKTLKIFVLFVFSIIYLYNILVYKFCCVAFVQKVVTGSNCTFLLGTALILLDIFNVSISSVKNFPSEFSHPIPVKNS